MHQGHCKWDWAVIPYVEYITTDLTNTQYTVTCMYPTGTEPKSATTKRALPDYFNSTLRNFWLEPKKFEDLWRVYHTAIQHNAWVSCAVLSYLVFLSTSWMILGHVYNCSLALLCNDFGSLKAKFSLHTVLLVSRVSPPIVTDISILCTFQCNV